MAISESVPTLWSARILEYLDKTYVYKAALTNNRFEGTPRAGGTVNSYYLSDVSTSAYSGSWDDADWTELTDNEKTITIDQETKVLAKIPRLSESGSVLSLVDQGSQRMAQAIGDTIDQYIASLHSQIAAGNAYGDSTTPITVGLGSGEIPPTLALARLFELLVDAKAPNTDCRVVIPSWMGTMLNREIGARETASGDAAIGGDGAPRPGLIATNISGFSQIHVSANVPNTTATKYKVIAGAPMITYASAIEEFNIIELQNDFAKGAKGLYVYGAKLLRGEYMALGTFNKGAYA